MASTLRRLTGALRHAAALQPLTCVKQQWEHEAQPLVSLIVWRGVKKQANEVRPGNILEVGGRLLQVVKATHSHGHGRQLGNVQLELRDVSSKSKLIERKRPSDTVEVAFVEPRPMQYLYAEGSSLHMMDPETYEQLTIDRSLFGDSAAFLAEGCDVTVSFHAGTPIAGELPPTVSLRVAEASPYTKGDSASSSSKPAVLENGASIMVPPFVQSGEQVVVDTRDGSFVRRAN